MSRKNRKRQRNNMAFRQKRIVTGKSKKGAQSMEPINVQFSITGWETDGTPREQIGLHQTLAIYGFRDLLEFACDNYTQSGRGVVIMRYSDLVDYNPNASTEFDVKVGYMNPVDLGFLPDPVSSKITAMITAYDVERTFVFVVGSKNGLSAYTFGCPL